MAATNPIDFPPEALPYCAFTSDDGRRRLGVGIGTDVVDLDAAARAGAVGSVDPALLTSGRLNELLARPRAEWLVLRDELAGADLEPFRLPQREVELVLAWEIPDYVDFFSSRHHAEHASRIFRSEGPPLLPNWLWLPVGYHGRSGTIVVDGTPVRRPNGQRLDDDGRVAFGPSTRLDFELEVGTVLGGPTVQGEPIPIEQAADHLFGMVLVNDWSARDIQGWESQPLGPFLGKSFATSVSAWVVPMEALAGVRVAGPAQTDPEPLPHLRSSEVWAFDIDVEAWIRPAGSDEAHQVTGVNMAEGLYWNAAQQLAHLTSNGASVRAGDLFASGTVSGSTTEQLGCLLELTWNGTRTIRLGDQVRTFLEDGDEVILGGRAGHLPLGPVRGVVTPAV
jgi:fumarylacetoacetase